MDFCGMDFAFLHSGRFEQGVKKHISQNQPFKQREGHRLAPIRFAEILLKKTREWQ
jgi:hypothetical protein